MGDVGKLIAVISQLVSTSKVKYEERENEEEEKNGGYES
jgi:hypothetical protein